MAPPGASSCFDFIIGKLGCQGNFCPEMSSQKGTVALLLFALKAISLLPPETSSSAQRGSTNAVSWLLIAAPLRPVSMGNLLRGHHLF